MKKEVGKVTFRPPEPPLKVSVRSHGALRLDPSDKDDPDKLS